MIKRQKMEETPGESAPTTFCPTPISHEIIRD
jgi:hypothetical protein